MALEFTRYLNCLQQSGLIEPAGIDYHLEQYQNLSSGAADDPAAFGQLLVEQGVLTNWQNDYLQQGRFKGFHVGDYTLLGRLPQDGAFRAATHHGRGPSVALRMLPDYVIEAFPDMAPQWRQITSPFVVHVLDEGDEGKHHYLIEECVADRSLQTTVEVDGPLDLPTALRAIRCAAQGLQALREVGLGAGVFFPDELLLNAEGARVASPVRMRVWLAEQRMLTIDGGDRWVEQQVASYGAPDRVIDARSEIYSLGGVLYFALVGQPPFVGSRHECLVQHREAPPPVLRDQRPDAPWVLANLFQRMLAKDPAHRPQSMAEVRDALDTLLAPWS